MADPSQHDTPHRAFPVTAEHDGWRLDRFLAERVQRLSRSKAARICRDAVWIEPKRTIKPSLTVRSGDCVYLRRRDLGADEALPQPGVIHREERLWIIDKPAGMLIHPTANHYSATLSQMIERGEVAGCPTTAEPVHRLDRETSGLVMVGLDTEAVATLRAMFATDVVDKMYLAAVHDPQQRWLPGAKVLLDTPLGFEENATVRIRMGHGDLPARTRIAVVGREGDRAWIRCRLETGRQHQIRAHVGLEGTPIVGDKLYQMGDLFFDRWSKQGGDPEMNALLKHPRHMLHAARLRWRCPWTDVWRIVDAPWPKDFGAPRWLDDGAVLP